MSELKLLSQKQETEILSRIAPELMKIDARDVMNASDLYQKIRPVLAHLQALEKKLGELEEIISCFDWKITGNHALTETCTRLNDTQIEILKNANKQQ